MSSHKPINFPTMVKTRISTSDFATLAAIAKNQQTSIYQLLRDVVSNYVSNQKNNP
jgi:hypothetical protein